MEEKILIELQEIKKELQDIRSILEAKEIKIDMSLLTKQIATGLRKVADGTFQVHQ